MLIDWLSREGGIVLGWWALVTLAGVAALPLCLRLLGGLQTDEIARAYLAARDILGMRELWREIEALDNRASAAVQAASITETAAMASPGPMRRQRPTSDPRSPPSGGEAVASPPPSSSAAPGAYWTPRRATRGRIPHGSTRTAVPSLHS